MQPYDIEKHNIYRCAYNSKILQPPSHVCTPFVPKFDFIFVDAWENQGNLLGVCASFEVGVGYDQGGPDDKEDNAERAEDDIGDDKGMWHTLGR